jgi:ferredoxin
VRVEVDLGKCQGYANCVAAAPDVFDLDEDSGLSKVIAPQLGEEQRAAVEEAARLCPVQAIQVAD